MLISEDALYQIIDDTWNSTLGFQVERQPEPPSVVPGGLTVGVKMAGAWEGEVRLHCPLPLARLIAGAIFEVDGEKAGQEEILDALSELIHIVGGNLKALLPQPVTLSLPSLLDPARCAPAALQGQRVDRLALMSEGHPFVVTLTENLPAPTEKELPLN
jgi:chemotaxis protein CheX